MNALFFTLFLVVIYTVSFPLLGADDKSQSATIPSQYFSQLPAYENIQLSPSGRRIAYVSNIPGDTPLAILATYDLDTRARTLLLQSDNEKIKLNWFRWANNEDIVVSARYETSRNHTDIYETRLFALRFDGKSDRPVSLIDNRRLKGRFGNVSYIPQFQDDVVSWLPDDPDHIMIQVDIDTPLTPSVYKVNLKSGHMSRVERGKRQIRDWIVDQQGNVRVGVSLSYDSGDRTIYAYQGDELITLFNYNVMSDKGVYPLGFGLDPNVLYYKAYQNDTLAVYKMDLVSKASTLIVSHDNYDIDGSLIYDEKNHDAIGIRDSHSPDGKYFWNDHYGPLLRGLNKALPEFKNSLVSMSEDENNYILYSQSDNTPGFFSYGDREKGTLDVLFSQYPEIQGGVLPEHELVTYKARDGTNIEGYLTLPKTGVAPYPTIIHPHGGPGARDYSGFDYWTAFFTNQGYAVLRPNFRGSEGYGYAFSEASKSGWGLQMQDDITDGTHWLIKQNIADPKRICIVGASYGGYAALMATVKTPNLFTCAVSFAGVSDLEQLVRSSRKFVNTEFVKDEIGDDDDDLESRSPINFVKSISTPLLLVHGDEDRVVDVKQSREMADELEDENKNFQYIELESGDHYLSIQRNRTRLFNELETFLKRYLAE